MSWRVLKHNSHNFHKTKHSLCPCRAWGTTSLDTVIAPFYFILVFILHQVLPGMTRYVQIHPDMSRYVLSLPGNRILYLRLGSAISIQIHLGTSRYDQIQPDTSRYVQIHPDTSRYILPLLTTG